MLIHYFFSLIVRIYCNLRMIEKLTTLIIQRSIMHEIDQGIEEKYK